MAKSGKKYHKSQTNTKDLVTVTIVDDAEEAKDLETLLKNDDIPVIIKQTEKKAGNGETGYAIMVPEEYLDEAHVVIESQDAYEDFYDFALDHEYDEDYDGDLFEEEL